MIVFDTIAVAIRTRLVAVNVCGGNVDRERNEPSTMDDLPLVNVMTGGDTARPEGDPRTGIPRFEHTTTMTVVAYDRADSGPALRTKLATHAQAIVTALLGDLAWTGDAVEGIGGMRQVYEAPPDGNEIAGRVQVQIDLLLRSSWPPALPADDLATVGVGIDVPDGTDAPGITIVVPTA